MQPGRSIKNKHDHPVEDGCCAVATVRVRFVQDIRALPDECVTAQVKLEGKVAMMGRQSFLVEQTMMC